MDRNILVILLKERLMVRERYGCRTAICMRESFEIISCKGLEIIPIIEVLSFLANSIMGSPTAMEKKPGQTVQCMRGSLKMARNMVREFTSGIKVVHIMVNGQIT